MRNEVAVTNALVAIHEDRLQKAEDTILEAISRLSQRHSTHHRSSIAASLAAMIRPSTQSLVWD